MYLRLSGIGRSIEGRSAKACRALKVQAYITARPLWKRSCVIR